MATQCWSRHIPHCAISSIQSGSQRKWMSICLPRCLQSCSARRKEQQQRSWRNRAQGGNCDRPGMKERFAVRIARSKIGRTQLELQLIHEKRWAHAKTTPGQEGGRLFLTRHLNNFSCFTCLFSCTSSNLDAHPILLHVHLILADNSPIDCGSKIRPRRKVATLNLRLGHAGLEAVRRTGLLR